MAKRPQLTGRAAILAVVVCAIAMSLAYPVREYVAQRNQLVVLQAAKQDQLLIKQQLEDRRRQLADPSYESREIKRRLHFCGEKEKCYVVMDSEQDAARQAAQPRQAPARPPWYQTMWESVEAADRGQGRRAVTGETKINGQG